MDEFLIIKGKRDDEMADIEKYFNRHKNLNRGYRKLDVWKEAINLFSSVKKKLNITKNISFKIKAQIEDSGLSIPSNIAEGYSRRHLKETIQFNSIALASLSENYTQIIALLASDDINADWFEKYDKAHYSLENKLINYQKSILKKLIDKGEWNTDFRISEMVESYGMNK